MKGDGEPLEVKDISKLLRRGLKMVSVPDIFAPYSIKHPAVSFLMNSGANLEDIARFA